MHLEEAQNAHLELASLSGQVVYSEEFKSLHGELQKQLDVTSFAKGVYVLKITGEKGVITRKVSLQ